MSLGGRWGELLHLDLVVLGDLRRLKPRSALAVVFFNQKFRYARRETNVHFEKGVKSKRGESERNERKAIGHVSYCFVRNRLRVRKTGLGLNLRRQPSFLRRRLIHSFVGDTRTRSFAKEKGRDGIERVGVWVVGVGVGGCWARVGTTVDRRRLSIGRNRMGGDGGGGGDGVVAVVVGWSGGRVVGDLLFVFGHHWNY